MAARCAAILSYFSVERRRLGLVGAVGVVVDNHIYGV
jgi:hypothetical protein